MNAPVTAAAKADMKYIDIRGVEQTFKTTKGNFPISV